MSASCRLYIKKRKEKKRGYIKTCQALGSQWIRLVFTSLGAAGRAPAHADPHEQEFGFGAGSPQAALRWSWVREKASGTSD